MITIDKLRTAKPEDMAVDLAYTVTALLHVCELALRNETTAETVDDRPSIATVVEFTTELAGKLIEACEGLEMDLRREKQDAA